MDPFLVTQASMEKVEAALGVSHPVFRFLICFVTTIPCSWLWRFVPGSKTRHLYSALTGLLLSNLAFGFGSNLHFLVPIILGYSSMLLIRRHCGLITFVIGFAFLIGCHVYYMSGDAWKEGGIDCTGSLMVLTLKVISCTVNYQDGLLSEDCLRPTQKRNRLTNLPSFVEYLGFCFCCGSHFAGPVYEIRDYLEWTEKKGVWDPTAERLPPPPFKGTARALVQALCCMVMHIYLVSRVPLSKLFEPQYMEWGVGRRFGYQWLLGFTARWKYYFIWSISEASIIISGFGFSGWKDSKPKWDRAKNVDIFGVELAGSAAELPLVWNIHVSTWLRLYVYDRLRKKGKKPGFVELLVTQTVSAVWHGLYAGYLLFFANTALMIAGSRVIYKWQRAIPEKALMLKKVGWFVSFGYTLLELNYACIGFLVLSFYDTIAAYCSIYYVGTLLPIVLLLSDSLIRSPKVVKPRLEKAD